MNGKIRASSVIGGARNVGRRDLLKSAGGFGAFAAVQGILPGSARAASPKSGGHLRVGTGFGSTTDSLDPAKSTSSPSDTRTRPVSACVHVFLSFAGMLVEAQLLDLRSG